jgi:hypothetical protein
MSTLQRIEVPKITHLGSLTGYMSRLQSIYLLGRIALENALRSVFFPDFEKGKVHGSYLLTHVLPNPLQVTPKKRMWRTRLV